MTNTEKSLEEGIKDAQLMVRLEQEALTTLKEFFDIGIETKETITGQEQQLKEAEIYLDSLLAEKMKRREGGEIRL